MSVSPLVSAATAWVGSAKTVNSMVGLLALSSISFTPPSPVGPFNRATRTFSSSAREGEGAADSDGVVVAAAVGVGASDGAGVGVPPLGACPQ